MSPLGILRRNCCRGCQSGTQNKRHVDKLMAGVSLRVSHCWASFIILAVCLPLATRTESSAASALSMKVLRITTIELEPYVMIDNSTGRTVLYGYIPDLLDRLAADVGFAYRLHLSTGGVGTRSTDNAWTVMTGEVTSRTADIAAAPLYVTEQRLRIMDFTYPFMRVHATILLRKPPPGSSSSFPIKSVGDIINQSEIKYGTLKKGRIIRAFQETNDTAMILMFRNLMRNRKVMKNQTAFTESNSVGIELVRSSKYGFILPDTIGEYLTLREPCDLIMVGRFLMSESFAMALQKNSPFKGRLDEAMRHLDDSGYLERLKRKWWNDRNECDAQTSPLASPDHAQQNQLNHCLLFFVLSLGTFIKY